MKEIEPIKINEEKENPIEKKEQIVEEPKKGLIHKIKELEDFKKEVLSDGVKKKKLKLPRKARVKGRKLKKGWIGIIRVDENRNATGEKQKVEGNAYQTSDGTFHGMEGDEILFWEGKFPFLIQFSNKTSPLNPSNLNASNELEKNETFGDKYKMAMMLARTIKVKTKGGSMIIWILIGAAALFGINYFMGGNLFG